MRKILLAISMVLGLYGNATAQVLETIYSEDFSRGLYFSDMTRIDYDQNPFHNDIINLNDAFTYQGKGWYDWYEGSNVLAVSPAKYSNGGVSDDWLITPAIELPDAENLAFTWKARSYKSEEPDGYRIVVSTTGLDKENFVDEPISVVDAESGNMTSHMASLEKYKGQTVYIAIHSNTAGFMLMIDDLSVVRLEQMEDVMTAENTTPQMATGTSVTPSARLRTAYGSSILNATVTWKYNGETYVQDVKSFAYDENSEAYDFKMDKSIEIKAGETLRFEMDIVSGGMNASCSGEVYSPEDMGYKRVAVIEERTGTWCGWCTRGLAGLEQTALKYPNNFIGIAVHNNDVMQDSYYNNAIAQYASAGFPGAVMNRVSPFDPYPATCISNVGSVVNQSALASMSVKAAWADESSKTKINVSVNTAFAFDATMANFNIATVLLEQDVHSESSDYDQNNNYSGGKEGSMYGYESKPNPIPGVMMYYPDVARGIYPEIGGEQAYTEFQKGVPATYNYVITVPNTILDKDNLEVVALLINPETSEIMNAASYKFYDPNSSIEETAQAGEARVYTSEGQVTVDLTAMDKEANVTICDMNGRICSQQACQAGATYTFALPGNGIYIIKVTNSTFNKTYKTISIK